MQQSAVNKSKYLIIGSSHAALEGINAIRMQDPEGSLTLITRDPHLPYSPTILPYIVSGHADPEKIRLRDADYFEQHNITLIRGQALTGLDPDAHRVTLDSGDQWQYEKLLLATGAAPAIPPVSGLEQVDFHVVRTLDDALGLRKAMSHAKRAVVLGAGFVGTHAAENLAKGGVEVTMVEMQPQMLAQYFDAAAASLIENAFTAEGIRVLTGRKVVAANKSGGGCTLTLDGGDTLEADLLVVATGVRPVTDYLDGSGIDVDQGILVDEQMQTSAADIWAAGDVTQAKNFLQGGTMVNGILPDAVEQGRIAGMAMCGDSAIKPYPGGVPINTFSFFGNQAVSVGVSVAPDDQADVEISESTNESGNRFSKILLQDNRLIGISGINTPLDAGVMWQLILRRIDLSEVKEAFLQQPLETGRQLMSANWR